MYGGTGKVQAGVERDRGDKVAPAPSPKSKVHSKGQYQQYLPSESNSKPAGTIPEGEFTALQNVAYDSSDAALFQATGTVGDWRQSGSTLRANFGHDDLIGVGVDH